MEEFINCVETPEFANKSCLNKKPTYNDTVSKWGGLAPANKPSKKKLTKANKEYLGYCDDPTNKELLDRLSDEENEYVYDYFPLMTKQTQVIKATGRFFFV